MVASKDDKTPPESDDKKGLFGWLRKKPQATPADTSSAETQPHKEPEAATVPSVGTNVPAAPVQPPEAIDVDTEPSTGKPTFGWVRKKPDASPVADSTDDTVQDGTAAPEPPSASAPLTFEPVTELQLPAERPVATQTKAGFFTRLRQGLSKTSANIGEGMADLFLGEKAIDDDLLEEIETRLLLSDVGIEATTAILQNLTRRVARKELADSTALYRALQEELTELLRPVEQPLAIPAETRPYVILVVGVNGVGKTTTIGKLARKLQREGKKVMLAAGDTFRAAAVEQLQIWGERNDIPVIAQHTGADSASVIFDAVQAAAARGADVLIADTAGRLHTKDNLMEELRKVRRVIGRLDATAPHEVLLVLDAGTGQNAISQTRQFNQAVELTGLALTKLDGTAKGGVIFALAKQFGLPIRYIGVGEDIDDLRTFQAESFVQALFAGTRE
ncbi:signal recognition particle-docking protein FtsY [Azomonas macrocytogenes]|uniref:Signal recognition particle receptor FtsY n=1 Tax=Azomonas macrocytogenes TaxID=69962 RepID=A0A839T1L9_AZOMA|nr:signal recognition particle-docking protein FtsY [Azomonas macrocytogenes]MBB3103441.1 fused signal recognition particle receptor [Azomonas macrocytogenes]